MRIAKALWHDQSSSRLIEEELPSAGPGFAQIENIASCISLGTELLVVRGLIPSEAQQNMAVPHMGGSFSFPIKYGYSIVGKVVGCADPLWEGRIVHFMCPHQDRAVVPLSDLFIVPDGISVLRATLASNMETAVNALWDGEVQPGDKVLVLGFGLIGSLLARCLSLLPGVKVEVSEIDPDREKLARKMGFSCCESIPAGEYDKAFHCSGSGDGLQKCIDAVKMDSPVIEMSWYGNKTVTLKLGGSFHYGRKKIISSQVSHLPPSRRKDWSFRKRKELAFEWLENPIFEEHIDREITLEEAPQYFNQWRKEKPGGLSFLIRYHNH